MEGTISQNLYGNYAYPYSTNSYFNPYTSATTDDFMAQQYFNNQANSAIWFTGYNQPQTDTFQSSGSSGLNSGLTLGLAGGLGTGAGTYFFAEGPVKDGKFADDILKAVEPEQKNVKANKVAELFENKKAKIIKKAGVPEGVGLKTLKGYSETGISSAFPKLKDKFTQKEAKKVYEKLEEQIAAIKVEDIETKAAKFAEEGTLQFKIDKLSKLQTQQSKLADLADDADLEKFFKDNAKTFEIEGDASAIEKGAKKLAAEYKNKAEALSKYKVKISKQENCVKTARKTLNRQVASYYDGTAKAIKKDAPEVLKSAFKNFKWQKAGKYGAIAAGAGLVLGWLFGGKNS